MIRLLVLAHAALLREPPMPAAEHGRLKLRNADGGSASRA
jgi:hypothetical protein